MTFREFSERVAHYCDEQQLEDENYFITTLNGVVREVAERFPEVKCATVTHTAAEPRAIIKMAEKTDDFASFSYPPLRINGEYLPLGHPMIDARVGEVIIPDGYVGEIEIFYNRALKRVTLEDLESDGEIPLDDDRAELAILLVAYRLLIIDEDGKAAAVKSLYDEAAYRLETRYRGVSVGFRSVDGWA